jgi:hypothetical protein
LFDNKVIAYLVMEGIIAQERDPEILVIALDFLG